MQNFFQESWRGTGIIAHDKDNVAAAAILVMLAFLALFNLIILSVRRRFGGR